MEPSFIKQIVNVEPQITNEDADVAPYSYLEWKERLPGLIDKDSIEHYNSYVLKWFAKNFTKPVSRKFLLRQKYLYLLDQLQLYFSNEEKNVWYNQINLADERELLHAIPYFAKKLKDIAVYYLNLRKRLKHTKSDYNSVGSTKSIKEEIYRYFLNTVATKDNERLPDIQTSLPSFSLLQNSLTVNIEELYDEKHYFGLSPTKPVTDYFNLLDEATSKYLATQGIVLSSSHWLFDSFNIPVASDNFDSLITQLTGTIFETTDAIAYTNFVQKYLAENKHLIQIVPELSTTSTYEVNLSRGNNYFYYPYGTTNTTFSINQQLPILQLSSIYIGAATAGTTVENSDTIIVKYGNKTKSAWLRYIEYEDFPKVMNAVIGNNTTTSFIYPFPGYGLSGVDLPWTGSSFETNPEYNFLSVELKAQVNQAYWSQVLPNALSDVVLLNNSTTISSGAIAHKDPRFADQIYIRNTRQTDTSVPRTAVTGAWLYKFDRTSLPVSSQNENVFLWPYARLDLAADYPQYLEKLNFKKACNPVSIQNISNASFIASPSFETSDKIYKLNKWDDATEDAMECAWLSGSITRTADFNDQLLTGIQRLTAGGVNGYQFTKQDGFNAIFASGETVRFIWTGPDRTKLDDVFKSIPHRKDCPFSTNIPVVTISNWQQCTCKQVYHTPFGHNGSTLEEGNYLADCIIRIPDEELKSFDFGTWRDTRNRNINDTDNEFAWYYTKQGWGGGNWRTDRVPNNRNPLLLRTGRCYIYRRAKHNTQTTSLPPYVVNYNFLTRSTTKWIYAKKDNENNWVNAVSASEMKFYPGDFIKIDRQPETTHTLLSSVYTENINENTGSIWATYDKLVFKCDEEVTTTITWPFNNAPFGDTTDPQYPPFGFGQLSSILAWSITEEQARPGSDGSPQPRLTQFISDVKTITFIPPAVGTYFVSVTAITRPEYGGKRIYLNRRKYNPSTEQFEPDIPEGDFYDPDNDVFIPYCIPSIQVVEQYTPVSFAEINFTTPTAGFLIEHFLKGWNYNRNKIDEYGSGARPYWATLNTEKVSTTRYKGIYSWGYPDEYIDEYLPNYNPVISPLELTYGSVIEYSHRGYSFVWSQPITYKQYNGTSQWCLLSTNLTQASNLSALYQIKQNVEPIAAPSYAATDIVLSNLIEGAPLEIYYYALNPFTWSVSYTKTNPAPTPSLSSYFIADSPWTNLTNRFYPTIANIPVIEELPSIKNIGGYFLPQHLGASQFVNKNFDVFINQSNILSAETFLTESVNVHIGGRGLTKQDQPTIFDWTENNQWLKESGATGELAGFVKKSLTKNLQTFIPYQSNTEETCLGLVTTRSRYTPWGGLNDEEWVDKQNEPRGFTGIINVSSWAESQVLKQNTKVVDNWASDIYGNQYGLYKNLNENVPLVERSNVFGELWVRTNNQQVLPGIKGLSAVYEPLKGLVKTNQNQPISIYAELTGNQVQMVNCYFDTLFIKTPSAALYAKITYNYELQNIEMVFDDARWYALNNQSRFEQNWFFSAEKKIVSLFTSIESDNTFYIKLYELDLITRTFKQIFETNNKENTPMYFNKLSRASLFFNKELNTFLITYVGTDLNDKMFIIDFYIKNEQVLTLSKIDKYVDLSVTSSISLNPPVVLSPYLSAIEIGTDPFTFGVSATNNPTYFKLLNYESNLSVSLADGLGLFTGILSAGTHFINYVVGNNTGETQYGLTFNASNKYVTQIFVDIISQTGSKYSNLNDGKIVITFYGTLASYTAIYGAVHYTAGPNQTITIDNLHTGTHEIIIEDEYFGRRSFNAIVGYTGYRDSETAHNVVISSIIEGYPLKTLFDI